MVASDEKVVTASKLDRYKADLDELIERGQRLYLAVLIDLAPPASKMKISEEERKKLPRVKDEYQTWYSEALATIRQLLPDRLEDFLDHYRSPKPRKELNASTYRIFDYLQGVTASRGGPK